MQQEACMILSGFGGNPFSKELTNFFFHPGENQLWLSIQHIGSSYKTLKHFIAKYVCHIDLYTNFETGSVNISQEDELERGMYLQAFCNTLDEVLNPYRQDIVALEQELLHNPHLGLTYIIYRAEKYSTLFRVLNEMIKQIARDKIQGCQLLGFLHRNSYSGFEDVEHAIKQILRGCHAVFFKQLSNWLLHGRLVDPYNEFFIKEGDIPLLPPTSSISEKADHKYPEPVQTLSVATSEFSNTESTKTEPNEDIDALQTPTVKSEQCKDGDLLLQESAKMNSTVCGEFHIDGTMLPPYLSYSVALKILFVGQTIKMCNEGQGDKPELTTITKKTEVSIWNGKEEEFFKNLHRIQSAETLDLLQFEKTINQIREYVTEHLWKLAIEKGELLLQLKLIKDFFLLGRGELFLEFIRQAEPILDKAPSSYLNRDVNQAFQIAAHKVLMTDESALDRFYFTVLTKDKSLVEDNCESTGWENLSLCYKVSWPLHLLFTCEVLEDYNHLFEFLLHVKKIQFDLNKIWSSQMEMKLAVKEYSDTTLWQLRNNLIFVINNLQYYLQVDVLESQYMHLQTAVSATKDFEKVQKAHEIFLANVLSQTFIMMMQKNTSDSNDVTAKSKVDALNRENRSYKKNIVYRTLSEFLSLCEIFVGKMNHWKCSLSEEEQNEVEVMKAKFMELLKYLLELLNCLRLEPCGTHLSQLLLRLDFNRWFSR